MGAIYLIDKGLVDFIRLFNIIHKNGAFLLLAIPKKPMHFETPSLYMASQTIGTMSFEKIPMPELFNKPINNVLMDDGQLDLF